MLSGATRGIGKAIAERLLSEGYFLSLGVRDRSRLDLSSPKILVSPYDARSKSDAVHWVQRTIEHYGRIDALINNAGILHPVSLEDDEEDAYDDMWLVNVKAPWRLIRSSLPYLKASGCGRIITIASMAGKRVNGTDAGYNISKFAAIGLTHAARRAAWDYGVRATAICPGLVATDMTSAQAEIPLGNMTQPEDIATIVATLLRLPNTASIAEILVNCRYETIG